MASLLTRTRWSDEQTLFLLELLLAARREQQRNKNRTIILRDVFKSFIPSLNKAFGGHGWTVKTIGNRYQWLRMVWRAFRAAESRPGTSYNEETGMLRMSKQNADYINKVHRNFGKTVTTKPLIVNETITRAEWAEIFSSDERPIEPQDVAGFAAAAASAAKAPGENSQKLANNDSGPRAGTRRQDRGIIDVIDIDRPDNEHQQLTDNDIDQRIQDWLTLAPLFEKPTTQSSLTSSTRATPTRPRPNRLPTNLRKRTHIEEAIDIPKLLSFVMAEIVVPEYPNIIVRPVGAADLEKAIRDCQKYEKDLGMATVIRIISWLTEMEFNPVIWNAVSKELKMELVEHEIGFAGTG